MKFRVEFYNRDGRVVHVDPGEVCAIVYLGMHACTTYDECNDEYKGQSALCYLHLKSGGILEVQGEPDGIFLDIRQAVLEIEGSA